MRNKSTLMYSGLNHEHAMGPLLKIDKPKKEEQFVSMTEYGLFLEELIDNG